MARRFVETKDNSRLGASVVNQDGAGHAALAAGMLVRITWDTANQSPAATPAEIAAAIEIAKHRVLQILGG